MITSLLAKELNASRTIDLRAFYLRRVRRIFPAFYAYLAVIGLLGLFGVISVPVTQWLAGAVFVTNYVPGVHTWWTLHSWSLSVEEQFYLLWPATLLAFGLTNAKRIAASALFLAPVVRVVTYFAFPSLRNNIDIMLPTRMDALMVGCLLAILWADPKRSQMLAEKAKNDWLFYTALIVPFISIAAESRFRGVYELTVGYGVTAVSTGIVLNYILHRPASLSARFLSLGPIRWLGRISYSLYLWQQLFLTP